MAKFLKEDFDKKETFDFAKQRKPFQVQFGLKKHVKNTGIYRYSDGGIRYLRYRSTLIFQYHSPETRT
jgi:hypothetical protein